MSFRKFIKKLVLFFFVVFFINYFYFNNNFVLGNDLSINARSYVVLDRKSKKVLIGKNEYTKAKMASTTKIMTATIILENCNLDDIVTISKKSANTGGSRLGLKTNDKISVLNLLYGLLLCSGNDAAVALAEYCSGSIPEFCNLMNQKAIELGLTNSHFETPHGLDSDGHYTTAYELALITDYALKNSTFVKIVNTKNHTIQINNYPKNLSNTNELLGVLDGVYGVKTGFTNGANRCLVTACKRNNMDLICIVLGCDTKKFRGQDSTKLINYCFDNFEYVNIRNLLTHKLNDWKNDNKNYFNIIKGVSTKLDIKFSDPSSDVIPIKKDEINNINVRFSINKNLAAPITVDNIIGNYEIFSSTNTIYSGDIISNNAIDKKNIKYYLFDFLKNYSNTLNSCLEF
jgi:D-alanyl-D-alanine carboxypeptidase (penicillin-binding protein 5/6)